MPGPSTSPLPPPRPERTTQSDESQALQAHFERVQNSLLTNGLLRIDGGGADVPFNARILTRNFLKIAFYQEYSERGGRLLNRENASYLHRWDQPIRYDITFGASVPQDRQDRDRREINRFANRLSGLTDLGFSASTQGTNLHVFVVNEDERQALGPRLRQIEPGISNATVNAVVNMRRSTYCLAFVSDPGADGTYAQAVVVIRGEHPDLLRTSCIHEEIAQSMGLPNDSPAARPSIFNDDEEFGFLTNHDEMLLRILYDRRLRPGMREAEARVIVETIAAELIGGSV